MIPATLVPPGAPCAWGGPPHPEYPGALYRYTLWRFLPRPLTVDPESPIPVLMVIGLNPSTASEEEDDPTIRRLLGYARQWGYGALAMTNLFALRATEPKDMIRHPEPVGPENDAWLEQTAGMADRILCAWGASGRFRGRSTEVLALLRPAAPKLCALSLCAGGEPGHPLYLPKSLQPFPYPPEE